MAGKVYTYIGFGGKPRYKIRDNITGTFWIRKGKSPFNHINFGTEKSALKEISRRENY